MSASGRCAYFPHVDPDDDALAALPTGYAEALHLRDQGEGVADIAEQLGIPVDSVDPLLRLAEAKLASLLDRTTGTAEDT